MDINIIFYNKIYKKSSAARNIKIGLDKQKKVCYTKLVKTVTERVGKLKPQREPLGGVKRRGHLPKYIRELRTEQGYPQ